jgi:hypothetical protein
MNLSRLRLLALTLVVASALIGGCGSNDKVVDSNSSNSGANATRNPESNNPPLATPDGNAEAGNAPKENTGPDSNKAPDFTPPNKPIIPDIDPSGKGGWGNPPKPSKAEVRVAAMDSAIKGLKNAKFLISSELIIPQGSGTNNTECVIGDQKDRYLLRYAFWDGKSNKPRFETHTVAKINGKIQTYIDGNFKPGRILPSGDILKNWPTDHSHYIANSIASDARPFSSLLAKAKVAGWKITMETKKFDRGSFERLTLESPKKDTKYEVMFEPGRNLPVTIQVNINAKKPTRVKSLISWAMSDKPLADQDLSPKIITPEVKEPDRARNIPEAPVSGT